MKTRFLLSILIFAALSFHSSFAQTDSASGSLEEAFEQMKEDSYDFENNEVIKKALLNQFWQQVTDTLAARRNRYQESQNQIASLKAEIEELEATIDEKDKAVEENQYLINHLYVLGVPINKTAYIYLNFIIILALGGVIGYGYGKYKHSNNVARIKTEEYEKAVEDLDKYKKKAKEKEMKLRRELQTEVNRNEELKKRISG